MKTQPKTDRKAAKLVTGVLLVLAGAVLILAWPRLFDYTLFKQLELRPGTLYHKFWTEPPQPIYMDIYLFNWTNPEDFTNSSVKPKFNEIGPYRFQEIPSKVNVTWHDENSTVSYRKQSRYYFVPEQSKGRLDDVITSVNVIALSSATQARSWNIFKVKGIEISLAFYNQKIHITKLANEWLFDGYSDPIISVAKDIASILGVGDVPFDRFGWFYMRNGSSMLTGDFNANTGTDDISKVDKIRKWNHESSTNFFKGECAELFGSAGEFVPPGVTKDQIVSVFSPEMCRSVLLEYESEQEIHGVKTFKFSGGDRTVDNGTLYPEQECYCSGDCVPSGLFNVSSCRFGTPVFMSFPHFYNADPFYLEQVEGMKPDKDKHQFFMSYEPKTSFPLEIAARFQLNLLVSPIPRFHLYQNVPRKFMPVLWFEQHVVASKTVSNLVKIILAAPLAGKILGAIFVIIGVACLLASCYCKQHEYEIANSDPSKTENARTTKLPERLPLVKN